MHPRANHDSESSANNRSGVSTLGNASHITDSSRTPLQSKSQSTSTPPRLPPQPCYASPSTVPPAKAARSPTAPAHAVHTTHSYTSPKTATTLAERSTSLPTLSSATMQSSRRTQLPGTCSLFPPTTSALAGERPAPVYVQSRSYPRRFPSPQQIPMEPTSSRVPNSSTDIVAPSLLPA